MLVDSSIMNAKSPSSVGMPGIRYDFPTRRKILLPGQYITFSRTIHGPGVFFLSDKQSISIFFLLSTYLMMHTLNGMLEYTKITVWSTGLVENNPQVWCTIGDKLGLVGIRSV